MGLGIRRYIKHETGESRVVARKPRDVAFSCLNPMTLRLLFTFTA